MRIGLIAPEFPPDGGGMAEFGSGLAISLAGHEEVTVYTRAGRSLPHAPFQQRAELTGRLKSDSDLLFKEEQDAWLALNAGLVPLAPYLRGPVFAYFHGNDFLIPWVRYGHRWLERIRRPYLAGLRHGFRRAAIRRGCKDLAGLFAISQNTARLVAFHLGVDGGRISICPPGVDDAFFQEKDSHQNGYLRLLTVSRLSRATPRKNIDGVLQAVRSLVPELPIRYTVVGDGDDLARLRLLAADLGLNRIVSFLGNVTKEKLLKCYREADLFILASKAAPRDVEGFGIVYLEASASGIPVICSREGGATDGVVDGWNGMLIPSSSHKDIAAAIRSFSEARDEFPPEQVRAFAERFRWSTITRQLLAEMNSAQIASDT